MAIYFLVVWPYGRLFFIHFSTFISPECVYIYFHKTDHNYSLPRPLDVLIFSSHEVRGQGEAD